MKRIKRIIFLLMISISFQSIQIHALNFNWHVPVFNFFKKTAADIGQYFYKNPTPVVCAGAFCAFSLQSYFMYCMVIRLRANDKRIQTLENKPAPVTMTEDILNQKITNAFLEPLNRISTLENKPIQVSDGITEKFVDEKITSAISPFNKLSTLVSTLTDTIKLTDESVTPLKNLIDNLRERIELFENAEVEKVKQDVPKIEKEINQVDFDLTIKNLQNEFTKLRDKLNVNIENYNKLNNTLFTFIQRSGNDFNETSEIAKDAKDIANEVKDSMTTFMLNYGKDNEKIQQNIKALSDKILHHVNKVYDYDTKLEQYLEKFQLSNETNKDLKRVSFSGETEEANTDEKEISNLMPPITTGNSGDSLAEFIEPFPDDNSKIEKKSLISGIGSLTTGMPIIKAPGNIGNVPSSLLSRGDESESDEDVPGLEEKYESDIASLTNTISEKGNN